MNESIDQKTRYLSNTTLSIPAKKYPAISTNTKHQSPRLNTYYQTATYIIHHSIIVSNPIYLKPSTAAAAAPISKPVPQASHRMQPTNPDDRQQHHIRCLKNPQHQ